MPPVLRVEYPNRDFLLNLISHTILRTRKITNYTLQRWFSPWCKVGGGVVVLVFLFAFMTKLFFGRLYLWWLWRSTSICNNLQKFGLQTGKRTTVG